MTARRTPAEVDALAAEAVRLRRERGLSFGDIARELGVNEATLGRVLNRRGVVLSKLGPAASTRAFMTGFVQAAARKGHTARLAKAPRLTPEEERAAVERFLAGRRGEG